MQNASAALSTGIRSAVVDPRPRIPGEAYTCGQLPGAVAKALPTEWEAPSTPAFRRMMTNTHHEKRRLEVTLGWQWSDLKRRAAIGYNLVYHYKPEGTWTTLRKDWNDDSFVDGVNNLPLARLRAARKLMAHVVAIAMSLESPHIRVHVDNGQLSGIIAPAKHYGLQIRKDLQRDAYLVREVCKAYPGDEKHVWCRSPRSGERLERDEQGKRTAYGKRYSALYRRLRNKLFHDGSEARRLWVDLAEVGVIITELRDHGSRAPTLGQALSYYLVERKGHAARTVADLVGVPTGQVNRSARTVADRYDKLLND